MREVLSIDVGPAEAEAFWRAFLHGLVERGPGGVQAGCLRCARGPEGGNLVG